MFYQRLVTIEISFFKIARFLFVFCWFFFFVIWDVVVWNVQCLGVCQQLKVFFELSDFYLVFINFWNDIFRLVRFLLRFFRLFIFVIWNVVFRRVVLGRGANAVPLVFALAGSPGLLVLELAIHWTETKIEIFYETIYWWLCLTLSWKQLDQKG